MATNLNAIEKPIHEKLLINVRKVGALKARAQCVLFRHNWLRTCTVQMSFFRLQLVCYCLFTFQHNVPRPTVHGPAIQVDFLR